ncbi:MAG: hypothetical protein M3Y85_01215 [Bacteroidota bacterium]|nr:hypothetical protein [Bacteroidota bacterium]
MNIADYTIDEHTHRFGLWTAARAASTSRFSNSEVAKFIGDCQLKESLEELGNSQDIDHKEYRDWFIKKANSILECMNNYENEKDKKRKKEFGVAAKIVSIYVKTVEVIPAKGMSKISIVAFPPIDRYLLLGLIKKLPIEDISWSKMDEKKFMALVDQLKSFMGEKPFWMLECHWDLNKKRHVETPDL